MLQGFLRNFSLFDDIININLTAEDESCYICIIADKLQQWPIVLQFLLIEPDSFQNKRAYGFQLLDFAQIPAFDSTADIK